MEITLKNIGIINHSTVKINGLTVIAGYNNTGKTTFGKVAYSIFKSTSKIEDNIVIERNNYIKRQKRKIKIALSRTREIIMFLPRSQRSKIKQQYKNLYEFLYMISFRQSLFDLNYFLKIKQELIQVKSNIRNILGESSVELATSNIDFQFFSIANEIDTAISLIDNLEKNWDFYSKIPKFLYDTLSYILSSVFSQQITPIKNSKLKSEITITTDDQETNFIKITNNKILKELNLNNLINYFEEVLFIDDPFILDESANFGRPIPFIAEPDITNDDSLIAYNEQFSYRKELINTLKKTAQPNYENLTIDDSYNLLYNKINSILPGTFDLSDEDFYKENGKKIKFSNLATGSKFFGMLKILIEKKKITSNTLLILDEPEAHLHPQWQILLAELLILLIKEVKVKIILSTHSVNFLLAIEAFMLQYNVRQLCNFYQTEELSSGMVDYCLADDLSKIYSRFADPFSEVKEIRDKFLYEDEE